MFNTHSLPHTHTHTRTQAIYYANAGQHMSAALTDNYDSHLSLIIMPAIFPFVQTYAHCIQFRAIV